MVLSWIRNRVARSNRRPIRNPAATRSRRAALGVESLESRWLMSSSPSLTIPALSNLSVSLQGATVTTDGSGNQVQSVQVASGSFTKGGVQFNIQDLDVQYTAATQDIAISGTASATIAGTKLSAAFGTATQPGIALTDNGSTLQSLTGSMTSSGAPSSTPVADGSLAASGTRAGFACSRFPAARQARTCTRTPRVSCMRLPSLPTARYWPASARTARRGYGTPTPVRHARF